MSVLGEGFALYGPLKKDNRTDDGFFVDINEFVFDPVVQKLVVFAKFYPTLTAQEQRQTTPWFTINIVCSNGTVNSTTDFHKYFRKQLLRDRVFFYRQYLDWLLNINPANDTKYASLITNEQNIIFNPKRDFIISTDVSGRKALSANGVISNGDRIWNKVQSRVQQYNVTSKSLSANAISTTANSNVITVSDPGTLVTHDQEISLSAVTGAINGVNGVPLSELNKTQTVTSATANSFTFNTATGASVTGTGGGSSITLNTFDWSNV